MNIEVWNNFSKRKNSTKQPTADGRYIISVVLKENTSIENPSFILSTPWTDIVYVKARGNYYFVRDVINLNAHQCQIDCVMDELATHKTEVLYSSQYVARSSSNYDVMIADPSVVVKNDVGVKASVHSLSNVFNSTGFYVISVLNNKQSGTGFTKYYVMDTDNLGKLANYCNSNLGDSEDVTDVLGWIQKTFLKTADAVISVLWLPLFIGVLSGLNLSAMQTVKIGKDEVAGCEGMLFLDSCVYHSSFDMVVPHQYTDFRKANPYSKMKMYIPMMGMIDINPLDFPSTMKVDVSIDLATGDALYTLKSVQSNITAIVSTVAFNVAVSCPVGKVGDNSANAVSGSLNTLGSLVGTIGAGTKVGVAVGAINTVASGVNTAASSVGISPSVRGNVGGRVFINYLDAYIVCEYNETSDPANLTSIIGRPLNTYRSLSGLSGYCQCADASINISGRDSEREALETMLNNGFYIE